MPTLSQVKAHLKLSLSDDSENDLLGLYQGVALAAFRKESKRRWPAQGEPTLTVAVDPLADPVVYQFVAYVDPAVLSEDEQKLADQWQLFVIGHLYENRQEVVADVRAVAVQVPMAAQYLMNLLREPTL